MFKPFPVFRLLLVLVSTLLLCLSACRDTKDDYNFDLYTGYYPIDSGHYVIYDVDSITYIRKDESDTVSYQIMEVIGDTLYDNENQLNRIITVYRRETDTDPWNIDRVWKVKLAPTNIQKVENDIRFIKLMFPPQEDGEWSGNLYVPTTQQFEVFKDWVYRYTNVHTPRTINTFTFDSTLTVTGIDDSSNVIEKKLFREVYANGVGMVYKEWEILKKQQVLLDWQTGVEEGFRIRMRVAGHN